MCKNGYVNYSDWSCQILSNSCKMLQTLNSYSLQMRVEGAQHLAGLNPKVCWINAIKSILLHRLCDSSSQHRGGASSKSYSFTGSQCHSLKSRWRARPNLNEWHYDHMSEQHCDLTHRVSGTKIWAGHPSIITKCHLQAKFE